MAGRIPDQFIDELLARVDIVDVIGERIQLKRAGSQPPGALSFSHREDPVVHRQPHQAVLPLLRLRRARHRHSLPHGIRRHGIP
ncbi:MAG: CHC2 zinc finger domain-containing protein [Arhodomonas sp.]|nr:CHC2 zinc finger domain-containing protein [Arhodomonas sp.]